MHVFLGDFDRDDPTSWRTTENKVGSFNVLGDSADSGCGKCKNDQSRQLQVTGQVPLTLALAERYLTGQLANLKPESVIPYLQTHLHWRVTLVSFSRITSLRTLFHSCFLLLCILAIFLFFTSAAPNVTMNRPMAQKRLVAKSLPSLFRYTATK